MALSPRGGNLQTAILESDATIAAGHMGFLDSDGRVSAITTANTGDIVIATKDVVDGDVAAFWTDGDFNAPSGNGTAGALASGAVVYADTSTDFDAGSTNDIPAGIVIGPSASNAAGADLHIRLRPGLPAKS